MLKEIRVAIILETAFQNFGRQVFADLMAEMVVAKEIEQQLAAFFNMGRPTIN